MTDITIGKNLNKKGEYFPFSAFVGNQVSNINDPIGTIYYAGTNEIEAARVESIANVRNAKFEWIKDGVATKPAPIEAPLPSV